MRSLEVLAPAPSSAVTRVNAGVSETCTLFLSRAAADASLGTEIGLILKHAGYRVVQEQCDFPNRSFMQQVHDTLVEGARMVALLSPEYLRSDYCAAEWQSVLAHDILNRKGRLIVIMTNLLPLLPV